MSIRKLILAAATLALSALPAAAALSGLGPIAEGVTLGASGAWTARDEGGRLVLANPSAAGAVRFYTTGWQGDVSAGRSVGVRVRAKGAGPLSAAGLMFRIAPEAEPRWLAYVLTSDGRVARYARQAAALKLLAVSDIPGGHRPEGDLLQIEQKGATTRLLANGRLVAELPPDAGPGAAGAAVGVIALGTGEFAFGDFAFGPLLAPASAPAGSDDTVPVPGGPTKPAPAAPPAKVPPVAAPAAAPAAPPAPALSRSGPSAQTGTVDVPGLGPLGLATKLGRDPPWRSTLEDGRLVLLNDDDDDAVLHRTLAWPGAAGGARSASLRIEAFDSAPNRGAGLVVGFDRQASRYLAFLVSGNRKASLYRVRQGSLDLVAAVDLPPAPPAGGDLLQISQRDGETALFANGRLVKTIPAGSPDFDVSGDVGLIAIGKGLFAFRDFAFAPSPQPAPAPAPAPPAPPPAKKTDVPALGPVIAGIEAGRIGPWTKSIEGGRLVLANDSDPDAYYDYVNDWPAALTGGRAVSLRVEAQRSGGSQRGGGIVFGYADRGARALAWLLDADGKATLYRSDHDRLSPVTAVDAPMPRPPGGTLLQVSQKDGRTTLLLDGKAVITLSPDDGRGLDTSGQVGLYALGTGRYVFGDSSFGPAVAKAADAGPDPTRIATGAPKANALSAEVAGAVIGITAHEFGHFMIGELKIPATGPEEDVADEFSAMVFIDNLKSDASLIAPLAIGDAKLWWYLAQDPGRTSASWYDEHAPDLARFGRLMCMLYGADPTSFTPLMIEAGIPQRTRDRCRDDEPKRHAAWDKLLRGYRRRGVEANIPGDLDPATPGHAVTVAYQDPKDAALKPLADGIRESRILDSIAESVTKLYALPRDTRLVARDCGNANAFYSERSGDVTICWELMDVVARTFQKHAPGPVAAAAPPSSLDAAAFLLGRWEVTGDDPAGQLEARSDYQAGGMMTRETRLTPKQGAPYTVAMQAKWSTAPVDDQHFELTLVPSSWSPQQVCPTPDHCRPVSLTTLRLVVEIVDHDTIRSGSSVGKRLR